MATDIAKTYDPKAVEDEIYRRWEASGFFDPDNLPHARYPLSASPFTIIMPPPNANGALHIGHAVFVTLQDILTRFWRMRGRKALWLPGADHAGFETQVVFEKKLEKEGRNRFEIPRDQLWREMWEFTQANKVVMESQLRKLGASCDWSREKFTLDSGIIEIVHDTFAKLYADGLAYRGVRVINWCAKHQTALSDLEVKYVERKDPLFYIKYGPLTLATVRPETKFGDTALAVNPDDKRYREYVGKELEINSIDGDVPADEAPRLKKITIKVIADEAVDPSFGTGVVKVTPAHDSADFEIWQRHKDEIAGPNQVIDERGRMKIRRYEGLKVAEARDKVAADMEILGLLEKIDTAYTHQVAACYKCENILEPLPKMQWFIKMTAEPSGIGHQALGTRESLRDLAVDAVRGGSIRLIPEHTEKVFFHWMENLRDWNISRQITWGIRIPAWYCIGCGEIRVKPKIEGNIYLVRHGETDWNAERRLQGHHGVSLNDIGRKQIRHAAEELRAKEVDLVISSDLARAREFAEILAQELHAELLLEPAFREQSYGVLEGKLYDEIPEERERLRVDPDYLPDGGETLRMVEARVHEAFSRHRTTHHHRSIVIVSHGAAIATLLRRFNPNFPNAAFTTAIANGSVIHLGVQAPCAGCGTDLFRQDPDVFDTWFSSGQWPFATLLASKQRGNPKSEVLNPKSTSKDFETFYPTDVMETGYDILFFWVARMIMLGLYRTGEVPFKTIYLHGLVRDKDRKKMSKSKGNVIDPLGVAEQYGTDAVRMALVIGNMPGQDIVITEEKIRGYRNFANKIWNIHRFLMMRSGGTASAAGEPAYTEADSARLRELTELAGSVTKHLEGFEFHHAAEALYHYIWHTFADRIIEEAKPRLDGRDERDKQAALALLLTIHETALALLHPFMPFITEALWQDLRQASGIRQQETDNLLMIAEWPEPSRLDKLIPNT